MDNIVGSTNTNFCNFNHDSSASYMLGLWCADGYHRTSSIGLSNIDTDLINSFEKFLERLFGKERIKMRVYPVEGKRKHEAYHVYVNSRPLLREFRKARSEVSRFEEDDVIGAYFAGRFDGDGSVAADLYRDCRIAYGNQKEAVTDLDLLKRLGFSQTRVYRYQKARTWVLYVSRNEVKRFLETIKDKSIKLQKLVFVPRRDLIPSKKGKVFHNAKSL